MSTTATRSGGRVKKSPGPATTVKLYPLPTASAGRGTSEQEAAERAGCAGPADADAARRDVPVSRSDPAHDLQGMIKACGAPGVTSCRGNRYPRIVDSTRHDHHVRDPRRPGQPATTASPHRDLSAQRPGRSVLLTPRLLAGAVGAVEAPSSTDGCLREMMSSAELASDRALGIGRPRCGRATAAVIMSLCRLPPSLARSRS